jgi:hypothetical protein
VSARGPYFVVAGHDVITFRTREEAEGQLEAIDVNNDEYRFFAADGTELRLTTSGGPRRSSWEGRVIVTDEVLGIFPDDLREKLRYYLEAVPAKKRQLTDHDLSRASLTELAGELARINSR